MGYDMYVVDEQGENVRCENDYWRRNMFGGIRQAELFVSLGLGYWADNELFKAAEEAGWPKREGIEYDYNEETDESVLKGDPALVAAYEAAVRERVRDRRGEGKGISVYKLCNTNDGWWVTKEECQEFLDLWEAAGKPDVDDFGNGPYGDTIPFIRAAVANGGFRVY